MQAERFNEVATEEDIKLVFQKGFGAVVERRKSLSGQAQSSCTNPSSDQVNKIYIL